MNPEKTSKRYVLKRDVYFSWEIMASDAFKELGGSAIRVLLRFLQKRTWEKVGKGRKAKYIFDNHGLVFTYAEAEYLGIGNTQFYNNIKKLVKVGFIDVEHQGGCYGKDYSRFALSDRWRSYGTCGFQQVDKKRSLQPGLYVQNNIRRKTKTPSLL